MFSKLIEVEQHYEQLSAELERPEVYGNPARLHKIAQKRKALGEVVGVWREYCQINEQIQGNEEILHCKERELSKLAQEELPSLYEHKKELEDKLKILLLPKDPLDEKNILLEIRSGAGGDEAALFVADLFRMYTHFAERHSWKLEFMSESLSSVGGFKEVVIRLGGEGVYSTMKFEAGVHRVQRVPVTESQGRIHTSTASVAVLPEPDELDVVISEDELAVSVCRASGPGGQGVNTTDSAVRVTHIPTGITVQCQDERSQLKNKVKAIDILRARLYEKKLAEQFAKRTQDRRSMVGGAKRAEKIRTYNFPQNRVSDHRIGLTLHSLDRFMQGELDEMVDALRAHFQAQALKSE